LIKYLKNYELSEMQRCFTFECQILRLLRFDFTDRAANTATAAIPTAAAAG
jgi:hypothetical protein